jgi:hypothetical protein
MPRWCESAARNSSSLNRRRIRSQPAPAILAAVNANAESSGRPLLCDFHIHTRFSGGLLDLAAVVDLFGQAGFDAINSASWSFDRIFEAARAQEALVIACHPHHMAARSDRDTL